MIAAIDPGLDRAVAAIFDVNPDHVGRLDFTRAAAAHMHNIEVTTSPGLPLPMRLGILAKWARRIAIEGALAVIEQPTIFGVYARNRNQKGMSTMPRGMAMLYQAMGALCAGAEFGGGRVELLPKPKVRKADAHRLVKTAFNDAHKLLPPSLQKDEDGLDAIFIGMYALSRWTKPNLTQQTRMEEVLAP